MTFAWPVWFCLVLLPLQILLPKLFDAKIVDAVLTVLAIVALVLLVAWAFGVNPPPFRRG
jgi:hypothetical protein